MDSGEFRNGWADSGIGKAKLKEQIPRRFEESGY
jgi:hypothetical protein